ncbi:serine/threonine-protein kinase, partial [Chloroflexota bacterium]
MLNLTGRTLGSYQILEEIGRGGMAQVYRAYQPSLNRNVAVKVLPPQLAIDRKFVDRFVREARAAASLRHPHIVIIHDVGEQDGLYYMVMEYLTGQTLRQLIRKEGSLPPARVTSIMDQLASALDYAHRNGFIHRDVKPSNIFVGEGDRVTLTDFGIAKAASEAQQLTREGTLMGTPEYMSPEQAEGRTVDYRSDLYALGVVLYHMLTGRVPFRRTTPAATLHAVIYEPPPPPRQIQPSVPVAVESVVLKSVAKSPGERYQRGTDLAGALQAAYARKPQKGVAAPPPPPIAPVQRVVPATPPARRRSPVVWIMAAIAVLLLLVLGGLTLLLAGQEDETASESATSGAIALVTQTEALAGTESVDGMTSTSMPVVGTETLAAETPSTPTDTPPPAATTPIPSASTVQPATATPKPPTKTPKPPTATPKPPMLVPVR